MLSRLATPTPPIQAPDGHWLLGHLSAYTKDPLAFLEQLASDHGPLARFRLAHINVLLVTEPELMEEILVRSSRSFRKQRFLRETVGDALGSGLLTSEGDVWLAHRQLAQPTFRPSQVQAYAGAMVDQTDRMLERIQPGDVREVHADAMRLTLDIAAITLFAVDVDARAREIGEALEAMMDRFRASNRALLVLARHLPTPGKRRYDRGVAELRSLVDTFIADRRADPGGEDLLSRLVRASDAGGGALTDAELRDELITMLVAGHETTALTLTWALDLLARHPMCQKRLHEELDATIGRQAPTPADLDEMPYLCATVDEAMRLYPPAWGIGREAAEEIELDGHVIPKGTQFMMSQWVTHRSPQFYEAPLAFRPERWLDGSTEDLPRLAYFPFGGGPRTCIGNTFALLEARLILARILQAHTLEPVDPAPPAPEPSITLRPGGPVRVRFGARS